MFKNFKYTIALDIIWFLISAIVSYICLLFIQKYLNKEFYYTLFFCIAVAMIYLRWILFPTTSFIFNNILIKVLMWIGNFPLLYYILERFNFYIEKIEDYAINFSTNASFPLIDNLGVNTLLWIKNITLLSFISVIFIIALMQIRIMWLLMRGIRTRYTKDSGY